MSEYVCNFGIFLKSDVCRALCAAESTYFATFSIQQGKEISQNRFPFDDTLTEMKISIRLQSYFDLLKR